MPKTRYSTILNAKRPTPDSGLLSYQLNEKEEIDNRPNFIHKAQVTDNHPQKLLEFVCTVFPDVKRTQAKQWLQYNSLLVNDEPQTKYDLALRIGDWISVKAGKSKGNSRSNTGGDSKKKSYGVLPFGLKIVYEDETMFIVDKPHALSVSSSQLSSASSTSLNNKELKTNSNNLTNNTLTTKDKKAINKKESNIVSNTKTVHSIVSSYLGKRAGSTESKVFIVNRLDDEESGLVIFAKSSLYKEYLLKNWNTFGVVYNILCLGVIFPQQGTIKTYMLESGSKISCSLTKLNSTKNSALAVSHYRTLESVFSPVSVSFREKGSILGGARTDSKEINILGSYSLLEISLETSKKDQLRAQFSFLNHSICGDYRYGLLSSINEEESVAKIEKDVEKSDKNNLTSVFTNNDNDNSNNKKKKKNDDDDDKNNNSNDFMSAYDPIRRLGIHLSEIRMTHPISKEAVTIMSNYPSSFMDPIRRSKSDSSSSLFEVNDPLFTKSSSSKNNNNNNNDNNNNNSNDNNNNSNDNNNDNNNNINDNNNNSNDNNSNDRDIDIEDGQLDTLKKGLLKHAAENDNKNEKIKVFTLTEFLGSGSLGGKSPARNGPKKNNVASSPPDSPNKFAIKKGRK